MIARFALSFISIALMLLLCGCEGLGYIASTIDEKAGKTLFSGHIRMIDDPVRIEVLTVINGIVVEKFVILDATRIAEIRRFVNAHSTGWIEEPRFRYTASFLTPPAGVLQAPPPPDHITFIAKSERARITLSFCIGEKRLEAVSLANRPAYLELSPSESDKLAVLLLNPDK